MAVTAVWLQVVIVSISCIFFVANHVIALYWCTSQWVTTLPKKSICLFNATLFAIICGFGGWYVWEFPNAAQLSDPLHGENLFQELICLIAVGYFAYDLFIVIMIDPSLVYLLHAILGAIFGYLGGVIPLASHAGSFVMSYEVSTPFKNLRYFMIKWGLSKSYLFRFVEIAFIVSFLYLRLVIGFPAMFKVTHLFRTEINRLSNLPQSDIESEIVEYNGMSELEYKLRLFGTVFLLYGGWCNVIMNIYWSWAIVKAIVLFSKKQDYTPDDENVIVYESSLSDVASPISCHFYDHISLANPKSNEICKDESCLYFGEIYLQSLRGDQSNALQFSFEVSATLLDLRHCRSPKRRWLYGLLSWRRDNHFGDIEQPLISCVTQLIARHINTKKSFGKVYLLTLLNTIGFGSNPVSVYYCLNPNNTKLDTVLIEVSSLPWCKRHVYVLPMEFALTNHPSSPTSWCVDFVKAARLTPLDRHYSDSAPNYYSCNFSLPNLNSFILDGSMFVEELSTGGSPPDCDMHQHDWGTSSCILPRHDDDNTSTTAIAIKPKSALESLPKALLDGNNNKSRQITVEFGLKDFRKKEMNNNRHFWECFLMYPFLSMMLRYYLYYFLFLEWRRRPNCEFTLNHWTLKGVMWECCIVIVGGFWYGVRRLLKAICVCTGVVFGKWSPNKNVLWNGELNHFNSEGISQ